MIIKAKYFHAPIADTLLYPGYLAEAQECFYCKEKSKYIIEYTGDSDDPGCINCLIKHKFSITKDTEIGSIKDGRLYSIEGPSLMSLIDMSNFTEDQIYKKVEENQSLQKTVYKDIPEGFDQEKLKDICYTPDISTYQGIHHPAHCNDFMIYIGRWEQEDFEKFSGDGNGEKLWFSMIDEDWNHLWRETEKEKKEYGKDWPQYENSNWANGSCVYVFECHHCKMKSCSWDCD